LARFTTFLLSLAPTQCREYTTASADFIRVQYMRLDRTAFVTLHLIPEGKESTYICLRLVACRDGLTNEFNLHQSVP
jgi:hypothetical protein